MKQVSHTGLKNFGTVMGPQGKTLYVSYAVKKSLSLTPHPNSLLLSADGETLYVTVKKVSIKNTPPKGRTVLFEFL